MSISESKKATRSLKQEVQDNGINITNAKAKKV